MNTHTFPLEHKFVNVGDSNFIAANEDIFNGDPETDVISLANAAAAAFLIQKGAGATGTATITVESCDDVTPSTATAVAFKYRVCTSGDTFGAWTAATASGFTTTAGANQMYEILIEASELNDEDAYVRLKATEVVDDPCDGSIIAMVYGLRYSKEIPATVLT